MALWVNVFTVLSCQSAPLEAGDDLIRLTFGLDRLRFTNLFSNVSVDRADVSVDTTCFAGCQTTCVSQRNLWLEASVEWRIVSLNLFSDGTRPPCLL